jgi:hypothetical protein
MNEELIGELTTLCVCGECTTCQLAAALESADKRIKELEAQLAECQKGTERLNKIAWLIGNIFVHGNFVAETFNEDTLEKLLRENGTFWESLADYEAARKESEK